MNTENFKRRLTAILSADVEGYSRLMRDNEDETVRTITAYRAAIAKLVEQYRGRVVDSPGDNILVEFGSGLDAVNCAVEIQRELAERNEELADERKMKFRIGVNSGDVIQEDERIYGDGVNIASRIEGLAEGGGICISGTVYDSIEGKLGLEFENLGEHEVKNIDKPIRVYRILSYPGAAAHRVVKAKKAVGRTWRNVVVAIAAGLILGVGALAVWHFYFRSPPTEVVTEAEMAFPLPDKPSIAVLPFVNVSGDPEQDYIADGITEQIIATLARNPYLFIIASNSTFTYKGKPVKVQQVSRELGVRYVVEGSVQKSGDRIRITAQLIDATTGEHLWAKTYDRGLKDIFALQDEITLKILKATMGKLLGLEEHHKEKGTTNVEACLKVLKACTLLGTNEPNNRLAQQMLDESIALDPKFARAYSWLASTYYIRAMNGWSQSPGKDLKRAFELTQKAIGLDQTLSGPHRILGWIYIWKGDHDKAIAEAQKAVALVPSNALNNATLGNFLAWADRPEDAIPVIKKASRLNPFPTDMQLIFSGNAYYLAGRYEEALAYFKKLQEKNPDHLWAYLTPATIYGQLGREKEAHAAVKEILRIDPKSSVKHWKKRGAWSKKRETWDQWIDGLRKAGLPENPPLPPVPAEPSIAVLPFANIIGDPKEDYLSDGITENIITSLSKTPQMLVIARNSVFTYKGKPVMVQQVSEELGVRYVLEGSVQRSGDKLRITAQLIDAKTGNHLWSESYDRDLKDLFDLQDDITKNVIIALQVKLTQGEIARLYGKGTRNLKAYLKVMKGVHYDFTRNRNENEIARKLFEEAIALDPNYANAYACLARNYFRKFIWAWGKTPEESIEKSVEMAKKALSLDEQNAGAYMVLANVYAKTGQLEKAMTAGKKGLSFDPANSLTNAQYGYNLYNLGKFREAIRLLEKAIRIDPKSPRWYLTVLGWSYFMMGQNEKAVTAFKKLLNREPKNADAHANVGAALIVAGKPEEAIEMLEQALDLNPDRPSWYISNLALARLVTGKPEEAITMMQDLVSSHPDNAEAYRGLSTVLTFDGRYEEALPIAKKAIKLRATPEAAPWFFWWTGAPYLMIGEYEEAIAAFKKQISFWSEAMYGHIGLTASYSLGGRMEDARAQAAEVLKINPKFSLKDIAKDGYYSFQKADKERFINALRKAGLK